LKPLSKVEAVLMKYMTEDVAEVDNVVSMKGMRKIK